MTDQERTELQRFADNEIQFGLIKKFLLDDMDNSIKSLDVDISNELLGERLKAILVAKTLVKDGFVGLSRFKMKDGSNPLDRNVAR